MTRLANLGRARTRGPAAPQALWSCRTSVPWMVGAASLLSALPASASDELELMPERLITAILLGAFVALVFPLNALIFRPLLRVMDEREEKIEGSRRRAADVNAQAEAALARYEEALRDAREESMLERRSQLEAARADLVFITRRAHAEAESELENAREELDDSLRAARETLRGGAEELARIAAERILGRSLS